MTEIAATQKPATPPAGPSGVSASDGPESVTFGGSVSHEQHITQAYDATGTRWLALQAALAMRMPDDEVRDVLDVAAGFETYLRDGTIR